MSTLIGHVHHQQAVNGDRTLTPPRLHSQRSLGLVEKCRILKRLFKFLGAFQYLLAGEVNLLHSLG